MAKFRDQPLTSVEIEKYLNSQDDFALEMQIYSLALSLGYETSHGGTYEGWLRRAITKLFAR